MLCRVFSLGCFLVVGSPLLFAGSAAAQDVSPRCQAAIDTAAGDYSRCLLRADARYAGDEKLSRLDKRQARCEGRFDRRTNRAIRRNEAGECPSPNLVADIKDRTASYAESVATEASGVPDVSFLFVQHAGGGTLSETTLTLTDVSSRTGYFSNRPYRHAGQMGTEDFISLWDEGENSFAVDPPNADFTCEVADEGVNYVVELTSPRMAGEDFSYAVTAVADTVLPETTITCDGESQVFIDASDSGCVWEKECGGCLGGCFVCGGMEGMCL